MKKALFKTAVTLMLAAMLISSLAILGASAADLSLGIKEDAYVLNKNGDGDQSSTNFGAETDMQLKSNEGSLTRYAFVKADISSLAGKADSKQWRLAHLMMT